MLREMVGREPPLSQDFIARTIGVARETLKRRMNELGLTKGVAKSGPKTGAVLGAFMSLKEEIRAAVREKSTAAPFKDGNLEW